MHGQLTSFVYNILYLRHSRHVVCVVTVPEKTPLELVRVARPPVAGLALPGNDHPTTPAFDLLDPTTFTELERLFNHAIVVEP